ncbi:MAG TPA: hypothetical protein VGK73_08580 [Polyangiaceae bacterium]
MKTRVWWIGAVLTVTAGVGLWAMRRTPEREKARPPSVEGEPGQLSRQVEALERAARSLNARMDRAETLAPQGGPAPAASQAPAETAVEDYTDLKARMPTGVWNDMVVTATLEVLEDAIDGESPDRGRSVDAGKRLTTLLAQPEFEGNSGTEVDCTADLCRFVVQHDDPAARERFRPAMRSAPLHGNLFFHFDEATSRTVVYVAREGRTLPRADYREAAARLVQD